MNFAPPATLETLILELSFAGISLSFGLQKYGQSLVGLSTAQRREEVRVSVGTLNDETLFGMVRFNRFNQNNGRMSVNWQVLEDGNTR